MNSAIRNVKKLLVTYLVLFPFTLIALFLQKDLPLRFAVPALIVPILVIVALWIWLRRTRASPPQQ